MKSAPNKVSEDRMKIIAVAAFVVVAAAIFYFEYFDTSSPAAPASAVVATAPATSTNNTAVAAPRVRLRRRWGRLRGVGSDVAHGCDAGERVGGVFGQRAEYFLGELSAAAGGYSLANQIGASRYILLLFLLRLFLARRIVHRLRRSL